MKFPNCSCDKSYQAKYYKFTQKDEVDDNQFACIYCVRNPDAQEYQLIDLDKFYLIFRKVYLDNRLSLPSINSPFQESKIEINKNIIKKISQALDLVELKEKIDDQNSQFDDKFYDLVKNHAQFTNKFQIESSVTQKEIGNSDFSKSSLVVLEDKNLFFVGNRIGEGFFIDTTTFEIKKELKFIDKIGIALYIKEKNVLIVSGVKKYIQKVNLSDFSIDENAKMQQEGFSQYDNYITCEYLPSRELFILGGFRVKTSLEFYNVDTLEQVKVITYGVTTDSQNLLSMALIPQTQYLVYYRTMQYIELFDCNKMNVVDTKLTETIVNQLAYCPEKKVVLSLENQEYIKFWKLKGKRLQHVFKFKIQEDCGINLKLFKFKQQILIASAEFSNALYFYDLKGNMYCKAQMGEGKLRTLIQISKSPLRFVAVGDEVKRVYIVEIKQASIENS